jgi:Na+-translocating ferredoxin:NAD+ oxidoreductase RnfD subunit
VVALLASVLEVLRSAYWPRARIHTGVLAYSLVYIGTGGAVAAYARPGTEQLFPEPIAQWSQFYGGATHFLEPITLYVGNVAGPVFATSLLAVVIGLAWLWYARRLSVLAAISFLVAGGVMAAALNYDPLFQLDSGPTWFVVGYALCDRRMLPGHPLGRPLMAVAVGIIGVGLRAAHLYIEALFITVAVVELVYSVLVLLVERGVALVRHRLSGRRSLAEKGSASA